MAKTYEPIQTQTLGSNTTTVSFTSIPSTYTDLVLVCVPAAQDADFNAMIMRFNSDSSALYSYTFLRGNGTSATSSRSSGDTRIYISEFALSNVVGDQNIIVQIQNYANTSTNKTLLARSNRASSSLEATVGLYRSTSAISRIDLETSAGATNQIKSGSTFTLYGIKSA
jgi:hypothetical protein